MVRCEECETLFEDPGNDNPADFGWVAVKVRVGDWVHGTASTDEQAQALQAARERVGWLCGACAVLMGVDGKDESA
jgi:hypothetical protein